MKKKQVEQGSVVGKSSGSSLWIGVQGDDTLMMKGYLGREKRASY